MPAKFNNRRGFVKRARHERGVVAVYAEKTRPVEHAQRFRVNRQTAEVVDEAFLVELCGRDVGRGSDLVSAWFTFFFEIEIGWRCEMCETCGTKRSARTYR